MDWVRSPRVIILDDERVIADTLAQILRLHGCDTSAVYTAGAALQALDEHPPDLLITDVALDPDSINGIDVAMYYERERPQCKILLISGHASTSDLHSRARASGHDYPLLHKPVPPQKLLSAVEELLENLRATAA